MPLDHQGSVSAEAQPDSPAGQPISEPPSRESSRVEGLSFEVRLAHPERWGVALALLAAILFNLIALYPEVAVDAPPFNDNVLHLLNIRHVAQAFAEGRDPTDPWVSQVTLGFPLFRHYQHLPYLLPGLLVALTRGALSAEAALRWGAYLLLSLFPLSLYWAGRRWGLTRLPALLAALLGPLLAASGLYGFEANSYVWGGYGLYTQLWGMWLLPLALAQGYVVLRSGRGYLGAIILVAATLLSHLVYGYILLVSLSLLAALGPWHAKTSGQAWLGKRVVRLLGLLALVALATSYFLVPYLADRAVMNRSIWESPWKYQSFGAKWVLSALLRGQLLDAGRFPTLTLLFALGAAFCLWRWGEERYRALASVTLLWLLLYFGRPTWGVLLDLLPMSRDLHLHRLIGGFHLGAIYLAGLGLAWLWELARSRKDRRYLLGAAALTALLLWPAYRERAAYYRQNGAWMAETAAAVAAERESLDALTEAIRALPPGRVYAGLANRWGRDIKVGAAPLYALLQNASLDMVGCLYHALSLNADLQVLFDDGRWEQYDLFNIRYVVLPQDWTVPPFYRALGDYGRFRLFEVPTGGYFDLVDSDLVLAGAKEDLYPAASLWLAGNLPLARQHPQVLLGATPRGEASVHPLAEAERAMAALLALPLPTASRGAILYQSAGAQGYEAEVQVERESVLMLKVGYHPRWRAVVDAAAAETVMLMPAYLGVRLPPGRHTVRLAYAPGPSRAILMGLGLLTLLFIGLAERRPDVTARLLARWRVGRLTGGVKRTLAALRAMASRQAAVLGATAVVVLSLLAGLPLLQPQMMTGHDAPEYITRAVEFFEVLRTGILLPQWAPDLNFGYGEPFFIFNPPMIYYLMSLFRVLGTTYVVAQNLASLTLLLFSGFGMYMLIASQFGRKAAVVAVAAYLFAPYLLVALYVRQALADFAAFAPLPFALWSLHQYATGMKHRHLVVCAISVAMLMLSSNPVALIAVPALLLWATWHSIAQRHWSILLRGLLAVSLGLALSAFFWIPALLDRHLVQTSRLLEGHLNYQHHFVYPSQLVSSLWGYGLSVPGPGDTMPFTVGPVHLLVGASSVVLLVTRRSASKASRAWLGASLAVSIVSVFFSSTLSKPLWDLFPILQYLQFPWRFFSLAALSSAILFGVVLQALSGSPSFFDSRLPDYMALILLVGLLTWGVPRARPAGFYRLDESWHNPSSIAMRGIGVTTAGEYAPIWVQQRPQTPAEAKLEVISGGGQVLASKLTVDRQEYVVNVQTASELQMNTFYFPGWRLYVNGSEHPVGYDNPQGVMRFSLLPGTYGIVLRFGHTSLRTVARLLSVFALLALALWGLVPPRARCQLTVWSQRVVAPWRRYLGALREVILRNGLPRGSASPRIGLFPTREKAGLYLLFLSIYLASAAGHFFTTDHIAVYLTAQSLVERGDLAIKPISNTVRGPDGRYYANYGIGKSLAVVPFYIVGRAVERAASPDVARYFSGYDLGDWGGTVPIFFASLVDQFVMPLIGLLVLQFCLHLGYPRHASWAVALIFGFCTAAWPYARDSFQHPLESLLLLTSVYLLYTHRERLVPWGTLGAGLALAGAVLTRANALWVAPALGVYLLHLVLAQEAPHPPASMLGGATASSPLVRLWRAAQESLARLLHPRALAPLLLFGAPVLLAFGAVLYLNTIKYGAPLLFHPLVQAQGFSNPLWEGLHGQLFSPGRSLFLYSPPLLLTFWAARPFYRHHRAEALLFAAIALIYLLGYSVYGWWEGGWSWGNRFLFATLPFLAIPLAGYIDTGRRALALAVLSALGMVVQVLGVVVNYSYVNWEWIRMALSPLDAHFYVPAISPIAMHWQSLWAGRHIDLWLLFVLQAFGWPTFLLTLALPLTLLAAGLWALDGWPWLRARWARARQLQWGHRQNR